MPGLAKKDPLSFFLFLPRARAQAEVRVCAPQHSPQGTVWGRVESVAVISLNKYFLPMWTRAWKAQLWCSAQASNMPCCPFPQGRKTRQPCLLPAAFSGT